MGIAWTVAGLAADIPLRRFFGPDVIVDGMTAIARRPGGTLEIAGRIVGRPPIGAGVRDVVGSPRLVGDVPLNRKRIIVVADAREVALLPNAAVDEGHLIARERRDGIGAQIGNDGVRVFAWDRDSVLANAMAAWAMACSLWAR